MELLDVAVRGELNCEDGSFGGVDAQRLAVGGKFLWRPRITPARVDVSFATVGLLLDGPTSWPGNERTRVVGLTMAAVDDDKMAVADRKRWLKDAQDYAPDVYRQLVRFYRQRGTSTPPTTSPSPTRTTGAGT
ncbi:hypothetical protein GCM10029964_056450 [Kibdelosporangium lantanae]